LSFLSLLIAAHGEATDESSSYLYQGRSSPIREFTKTENDFQTASAPKIVEFYSPHCVSV
jgi:hypothetical protein